VVQFFQTRYTKVPLDDQLHYDWLDALMPAFGRKFPVFEYEAREAISTDLGPADATWYSRLASKQIDLDDRLDCDECGESHQADCITNLKGALPWDRTPI
jgi:hypothetical protein